MRGGLCGLGRLVQLGSLGSRRACTTVLFMLVLTLWPSLHTERGRVSA